MLQVNKKKKKTTHFSVLNVIITHKWFGTIV